MKRINVRLAERSYPILIGRGLLARVGALLGPLGLGRKALIVTNRQVGRHYSAPLLKSLHQGGFDASVYLLPHGNERDKSAAVLTALWRRMAGIPLERSSTVVALGGGVVGDLAGFAAATYMRGISLVHVPTTLLGQVDSAIGGKMAIDLPEAKNVVGAFYQPRMVIADVETLRTLGPKEVRSQFAEVIKYGMIADPKLFSFLEEKAGPFFSVLAAGRMWERELLFLEKIVARSAAIKARVVETDERETKGARMILNYGHTFAHALEAASGFCMPHGDAVGIGMVMAGSLASSRGIFSRADELRQRELLRRVGLPVSLAAKQWSQTRGKHCSATKLVSFMKRDKKVRHGRMRFVLPRAIGKVVIVDNISEREVKQILEESRS